MVWAGNHSWAKLSFELSPAKQPTMVTVVTRGLSDDCISIPVSGNTVYIQIAKSGPAYVFYSSTDGKSWQVLRVFSLGDSSKARIGFESQITGWRWHRGRFLRDPVQHEKDQGHLRL